VGGEGAACLAPIEHAFTIFGDDPMTLLAKSDIESAAWGWAFDPGGKIAPGGGRSLLQE